MSGNVVSDEDYFVIKLHKNLQMNVTKSTYDKIQKMFDKFSYQYDFKWEDVAEIFNVKKSRVSEIVALLLNSNLIESSIQQNINLKNKKQMLGAVWFIISSIFN